MDSALMRQLSAASTHVALNVGELRSLAGIEAFPQIVYLSLYGGRTPSLAPLAGLPKLEHLSLGMGPCPELGGLAGLPLATLDLGSATTVDVRGLRTLEALRTLTLPESQLELDFLGELSLEALTLGANYPGLARVRAEIADLTINTTKVADLAPIAHLSTLRQLRLGARRCGVSDLSPLAGMPLLEGFSAGAAAVTDLRPLAGCVALRSLSLASNKKLADLRPLAGLAALESLDLNLTAVADLSPLSGLAALEVLKLRGTRVESIDALLGLSRLRMLFLEKSRLRSIAGISRCVALELLWFWGTKVRDLAPLAGLELLEDLNVAGLGAVAGADVIRRLPALRTLDVIDTEFDPQILRGKAMDQVRGCPYPPPGGVHLDEPGEPPTDCLGPGKVLDGRLLAFTLPSRVCDLALSADGSRLAVAIREGVRLVGTVDGAELAEIAPHPRQFCSGVAFGGDGALYVATHHDVDSHAIEVWRWRGEGPLEPFAAFRSGHAPRLHAHGRQGWLAASGEGVRVWRLADGALCLDLPPAPGFGAAVVCAYGEESSSLYIHGTVPGKVVAVNPEGVELGRWEAAHETGEILTVSDDGRYFTSMGTNCYGAVLVDTRTGERLYREEFETGRHGGAVVLSRDGSLVVECQYRVKGLRLPPGPGVHLASKVPATGVTPNNACVSADGRMLAFSTFNYRLGDFRVFWTLLVDAV